MGVDSGVVIRRWIWLECIGVASGCGCKEVYRFPYITYPYSTCWGEPPHLTYCCAKSSVYIHIYIYYGSYGQSYVVCSEAFMRC